VRFPIPPQSERLRTHLKRETQFEGDKTRRARGGTARDLTVGLKWSRVWLIHRSSRVRYRLAAAPRCPLPLTGGREPEPDGLAARREKDYEGGDGEEARGAGAGPHRREFRWDASTSKQAKKVRRGPAESVQVTAWFIRRARITLGQAFSWGGLFMVIVTEIRGLRLNQRDMGRIRWRGAALSKTLLGRLQKFLVGPHFQFAAPFRSDEN
jgi:hypothetical protein